MEASETVKFKVNGVEYTGQREQSLLDVLLELGYQVPHLCHHQAVTPYGACRLCLVEVQKGKKRRLTTSCNYPLLDGIEVFLDTEKVMRNRRTVLQLLLAQAPRAEKVRELAAEYGVTDTPFQVEDAENRCINCGLCARVCRDIVGVEAIAFSGRGLKKRMVSPYDDTAEDCIGCGACVYVCPTDCIGMKEENGIRHILRWKRKLPLKTCSVCGRPFAPTFQLNKFAEWSGRPREFFDKCQDCR